MFVFIRQANSKHHRQSLRNAKTAIEKTDFSIAKILQCNPYSEEITLKRKNALLAA
jgi:hypothetical protein